MLALDCVHNWRIKKGDKYFHATAGTFADMLGTHCSAAADGGEACVAILMDQVDAIERFYIERPGAAEPPTNPFMEHLNAIAPVLPEHVRALVLARLVNRAVYGFDETRVLRKDVYYYHRLEKFLKSPIVGRDFIMMPICYETKMHESLLFVKRFPQRAAELHAQGRFDHAKFVKHALTYAKAIDCRLLRYLGQTPHPTHKCLDFYEYDLYRDTIRPMMLEIGPLVYHGMQGGPKPRRFKAPRSDVHWTAVRLIFSFIEVPKPAGYFRFVALPNKSKKRRRGS